MPFHLRPATTDDVPQLSRLMSSAIDQLQRRFLDPSQVRASHAIMGIDSGLIDDGTYFVVESGTDLAGCGGWSRRATLYGGDAAAGRDDRLLDPATEPARVRAMYTAPAFARRGVGRMILERCRRDAAAEGFRELELVATLAGRPLYRSFGFRDVEQLIDTSTGVDIPLTRMTLALATCAAGGDR